MIIARLSDGTLLLGLSAENIRRLTAGDPIQLTPESHNLDLRAAGIPRVMIFTGETEQSMRDDLMRRQGEVH